uniref:Serum/glucocorticoid regulated kinase 1 n=1 Tax=Acrobeloides nanus TaxID=290746 RepID=A0A914CL79_9BILA
LFTHLQSEKSFTEPRARFYAAEIASALGYLHLNNIIYRDLNPKNLLLDRFGHVVLIDFGLCKEGIKLKDKTDTFCGTPEYLAPEVILKKPYDRTVDWWCFGSVLYEMLFGLPPFYSKNQNEMYERIVHQPLVISSMVSAAPRDILSQLLQKNSAERLGSKLDFEEIRDHAFFLSINWEKLIRREIKPQFVPKLKNDIDDAYISDELKRQPINPGSLFPGPNNALNVDNDFVGFTFVQPSALEIK